MGERTDDAGQMVSALYGIWEVLEQIRDLLQDLASKDKEDAE